MFDPHPTLRGDDAATNPAPEASANGNGNGAGVPPLLKPTDTAPDPFDPARLRLSQDFAASVGVKKLLTTVPVRRAGNQPFVRVHPSKDYRLQTYLLETDGDGDRESYLVEPSLWNDLAGESAMVPKTLFLATTRQGVLHLWPVRLPGPDGKLDPWNESAREAAERAMTRWVRVASDRNLGAYTISEAIGDLPEPEWPDMPFRDILAIAFKRRTIDTLAHPVVRRLRGEA